MTNKHLFSVLLVLATLARGQDAAPSSDTTDVAQAGPAADTATTVVELPSSTATATDDDSAAVTSVAPAASDSAVPEVPGPAATDAPTDSAAAEPSATDAPTDSAAPETPATDSAAGSATETAAVEETSAAAPPAPPAPTSDTQVPIFATPEGVHVEPLPPPGPPERYERDPNITAPLNVTQFFNARWQKAHQQATTFLADWTPEEKIHLVTGSGWTTGRCVGNTPAIEAHGWKGLCLQDSPTGVRFADQVSLFTPAINAAATFDKKLIYERGKAMGAEFKGKGINIALGPMTNMGRVAAGGRNWEGFGGDPYLSGWATYQTIKGMQKSGVQATVKHYIANEEERIRHFSSSNIDDRPLHEVYLHPFLRAVQADVAAVMASYNMINGTHGDRNSKTMNDILKTELGFAGYVMSDWDSIARTDANAGWLSANAGLDMMMPGDIGFDQKTSFWGPNLLESVRNGSVSAARFDDMAQRIVAGWYLLEQDKNYPDVNFDSWHNGGVNNSHVNVRKDHDVLIRQLGAASTVLLKNTDNALPLRNPDNIAIIGSDMGPSSKGPNGYPDRGGNEGTLAIGWGSGTAQFPFLSTPLEAISERAHKDRALVNYFLQDWDTEAAAKVASTAGVAIVGISSDSGEEYITVDGNVGDRNNLSAWNNGDNLVKAVAAACNNTIVVVHTVGPINVEQWIDHPNVTGVLWAGLPGEEAGRSLVDVLYGDYNPSGRLPYTIARNRSHYPAEINYVPIDTPYTNVNYDEGLDIDYRHFLRRGIAPRFPFGYGGSYTTFEFSNINVSPIRGHVEQEQDENLEARDDSDIHTRPVPPAGHPPPADQAFGRSVAPELHTPKWTVSAEIKNTGNVNGCEVPQLYLSFPESSGEPPRVLRDFDRINLDPGASKTVSFRLSDYDLSIWDVVSQRWVIPDGDFTAIVARHSFDDDGVKATFCPGKR